MTSYTIEPYVGPLPLLFGMTPDDVTALLGPPLALIPDVAFSHHIEQRPGLTLGYSSKGGGLFEACFTGGHVLLFRDNDLFQVADPIAYLRQFDDPPFLWVGCLLFLKL